ncbi:MAG: argininosuccinate lyase [Sphingobacteriia bacterium]|nr:MAG: argininosuccinate lyase [Sphingobacteriia bacterium]
MKLWHKDHVQTAAAIEQFTVGQDREFDQRLAPFDVLGSLAHTHMLQAVGLMEPAVYAGVQKGLQDLYVVVSQDNFTLPPSAEDIHSYVEAELTARLGEGGKQIHSARSRNDQVLVDIKMLLRSELEKTVAAAEPLFVLLQSLSEKHSQDLLPGYTHLQLAMPSSFGLWFGAYAESLADDLEALVSAYGICNKNPLGSAAGFGSSFPIDRNLTTRLLGFDDLHYNVVYAQMSRGKTERMVAMGLANFADTLSRLSMDVCLFMNQQFGFMGFPDAYTTGSSIMPHKKNPDVFELVRSHCNQIKSLPNEIMLMTTNLPSGYQRDLQLLKTHLFPALQTLQDCFHVLVTMFSVVEVRPHILSHPSFQPLFTVEAVNQLVLEGMSFRDAYQKVGAQVAAGEFAWDKPLAHTHLGSMGQLANAAIAANWQKAKNKFPFNTVQQALEALLQ